MEATCKTLVTQRLKRSGMAWTQTGGQAILTLRSLIQSDRWPSAWDLLRTDFCRAVTRGHTQATVPKVVLPEHSHLQQPVRRLDLSRLRSSPFGSIDLHIHPLSFRVAPMF